LNEDIHGVCWVYIVNNCGYKRYVGNRNNMEKWVADLFCIGYDKGRIK